MTIANTKPAQRKRLRQTEANGADASSSSAPMIPSGILALGIG